MRAQRRRRRRESPLELPGELLSLGSEAALVGPIDAIPSGATRPPISRQEVTRFVRINLETCDTNSCR